MNGQLNGSRNGNASLNRSSLNGNGSHASPRRSWVKRTKAFWEGDITSSQIPPVVYLQVIFLFAVLGPWIWTCYNTVQRNNAQQQAEEAYQIQQQKLWNLNNLTKEEMAEQLAPYQVEEQEAEQAQEKEAWEEAHDYPSPGWQ